MLHVQHEALSIVLGADMETHHNPLRGWTAVIGEAQISGQVSLYPSSQETG